MSGRRVALIVGGTQRLGLRIAEEFATQGHAVAVNGRTAVTGAAAEAHLRGFGPDAAFVQGDATDEQASAAIVAATVERFGRLDAVVLCAVRREHRRLADLDFAGWRAAVASVLDSAFLITRAAAPHLARTRGAIVAIGGLSSFLGSPGPATPAAKAGLGGFVRSIAQELGPEGVRINLLSPGRIDADTDPPEHFARMEKGRPVASIPLRRAGTPDDVAAMTVALCGDTMGYVTGQTIHLNGGLYFG